ncbi:MAG: hypothetical protein Q9192_001282 [Flavoplaca navasiana]
MSPWEEYKELAAYVATPLNNNPPHIHAEYPELRGPVDENIPPLPNGPSEIMPAEDYEGDWPRQQAEPTIPTVYDLQSAPVDHVTVSDRAVATTTNLPSADSTATSYDDNAFSQEDFLNTLFAADALLSMANDNRPLATYHTPNSTAGSNPYEHSSNPPILGNATTGFVFANGLLANTSFDFGFGFDADFDPFIGAPNLASGMASRQ